MSNMGNPKEILHQESVFNLRDFLWIQPRFNALNGERHVILDDSGICFKCVAISGLAISGYAEGCATLLISVLTLCAPIEPATMELILAPKTSYLNTVLTNAEGLSVYKVETSPGLTLSRTTTISKFLPESDDLKELAKITWHWMASSKLQFRGKEVDLDTYVAGDAHHTFEFRQ